jgi:hypothetical protein
MKWFYIMMVLFIASVLLRQWSLFLPLTAAILRGAGNYNLPTAFDHQMDAGTIKPQTVCLPEKSTSPFCAFFGLSFAL